MSYRPTAQAFLSAITLIGCLACGHRQRAVQAPDAPLGRVIVYRNGVAYFERRATLEGELTLEVPSERVDDFLKSLTITDAKSDEPLAISYPTANQGVGGSVVMTIALPEGRRDVRIAYVTESPAWKPSYRLILGADDRARLQSWAIVDNASNEAWRDVTVGVGSTAALSFRYDLHSVKLVQRETLDGETQLALAPPQGGSPYAVADESVRVLAALSSESLDSSNDGNLDSAGMALPGREFSSTIAGEEIAYTSPARGVETAPRSPRRGRKGRTKRTPALSDPAEFLRIPTTSDPAAGVGTLIEALAGNTQRVRIEGWNLPGEAGDGNGGLRRAETLRDRLLAQGIAAERIEVVGHRESRAADQVVRVIAIDDPVRPSEAKDADVNDGPRGLAQFMTPRPMTVEAGHSAMVALFAETTGATRAYLYDPVSERGSKRYAFNAVRLVNPTDDTLDSGPITVYADRQFLGEGLTEPIPPHAAAVVPFAIDRTVVVETKVDTREQIEQLRKLERGIASTQTRRIQRTVLALANRGHDDARVFVRHRVAEGWTLIDPPAGTERMRGDYLLPVAVAAGKAVTLTLEESTPVTTSIDLRSDAGLQAIALYLELGRVDAGLRRQLEAILAVQRKRVALEETLATRRAHAEDLRVRVGELTEQLVTLRKVGRAQTLSGHLAKRMRSLGDRLDDVGAEIGTLETQRLEAAIELDNLIGDLTLPG